jgi:hypothetical protein
VAYVANANDFAVQVISTNGTLIRPALTMTRRPCWTARPCNFVDPYDFYPDIVTDRVSIVDDPYNVAPNGSKVITEISSGGEITVKLGRKVYARPKQRLWHGSDRLRQFVVYRYLGCFGTDQSQRI